MLRLMQNLFDDFWNSVVYTDIIESDIQFFLDSHRKVESLLDLPACPFLNEIWAYCFLGSFSHPRISPPFSVDFPRVETAEGFNYNDIFLALAITFMVLPSYEYRPPADYESLPSLETKKSHILSLGLALTHAQDCFGGMIDGIFYPGLEFLSRLASIYGVTASFFPVEGEDVDFLLPFDPSRIRIQHVSKLGRYHREAKEVIHFLRK